MSPVFREKTVQSLTNPYAMDTNISGWRYPLFQTLTFCSCLPSIAVDVVNPTASDLLVWSVDGRPLYDEELRL